MGYRISTLASLPVIPGKSLYVFVLGAPVWDESLMQQVEKNFAKVAKGLGPKGAIVMGHEGVDLAYELIDTAENGPVGLKQLLANGEAGEGAVLIVGAHPAELGPDDLVLYATLEELETRFGSLSVFFTALCDFSERHDETFLKRFQSGQTSIDRLLDVVDLKPNFFGIGVNINKALDWWRG